MIIMFKGPLNCWFYFWDRRIYIDFLNFYLLEREFRILPEISIFNFP